MRNHVHDTPSPTHTPDPPCPCCGHKRPYVVGACTNCRIRMADWLAAMPGQVARLALCLVPGSAPAGERVTTSRTGSPTPARLDVLSLIGPGIGEVRYDRRSLIPRVRRWATVQTVKTSRDDAEHQIPVWHRTVDRGPDGRPLLALADDQVGSIPPAEWVDMQVRAVRRALGHHVPGRTRIDLEHVRAARDQAGRLEAAARRAQVDFDWLRCERRPQLAALLELAAARRQPAIDGHQQRIQRQWLGQNGHGGLLPAADREDDQLADEWRDRYGLAETAAAVEVDTRYLTLWLDEMCDRPLVDVPRFHAELRALHAELERTLGETRDEQYLGRCPTMLTDRDTGAETACGMALWQDPHASVISCARCRSTWAQGRDWIQVAIDIQRVWPVDRRRRYTVDDANRATDSDHAPRCPAVGHPLPISWRDVTEARDKQRMWRPEVGPCRYCDSAVAA